jgi:penicillin amidase
MQSQNLTPTSPANNSLDTETKQSESKVGWWPWLGAALVGLGVGAAGYWAHYRRPLPTVEGVLKIDGLEAEVIVTRDSRGIPTIQASNWRDVWRAQGFLHAQDRCFQMDLQRRAAAGRLSELFGERTIPADRFLRRLGMDRAAEAEWVDNYPEQKEMLECYTQGANACLKIQPPSSEYAILGLVPEPFKPQDCLLWVKMMAHDLACNWESELFRGRLIAACDDLEAAAAWCLCPPAELPQMIGGLTPDLFDKALAEYRQAKDCLPKGFSPGDPMGGSNAWAVSGAKSESGFPILANDPHLSMKTPDFWYQMRIVLPDRELFGASMPNLPGLILGHNGQVAWGVTNSFVDVHDLFVEKIHADRSACQGPNGQEPLRTIVETIKVKGKPSVEETVFETARGPLITSIDRSDSSDGQGYGMSLAWSSRAPGKFFRAVYNLNCSDDVPAALESLADWHSPVLNFVLADKENIAHQVVGRVPRRRRYSGLVPMPAWDGSSAWQGFLDYSDLPRILNPEKGFVASANNAIADDSYPHFLSWDFNPGLRAERIEAELAAQDKHSLASFQILQTDYLTTLGQRFRDGAKALELSDFSKAHPLAKQAYQVLVEWDCIADVDSCGETVYQACMGCLAELMLERTFGHELALEVLGETSHNPLSSVANHASRFHATVVKAFFHRDQRFLRPAMAVAGKPADWTSLFQECLDLACKRLAAKLGSNTKRWTWGRLHTLQVRHPLSKLRPLFPYQGPFPIGGDSETVNQTGVMHENGLPGEVSVAGSWRFIMDLGTPQSCCTAHCPGQSGHPGSPNYSDGVSDWLKGRYIKPLSSKAAKKLRLIPV